MPYLKTGWNCSVSKPPVISLQYSLTVCSLLKSSAISSQKVEVFILDICEIAELLKKSHLLFSICSIEHLWNYFVSYKVHFSL